MQHPLVTIEVMDDDTAEMLRSKTPLEKLKIASDAREALRFLVAGGVRWQHPDWIEEQVQAEATRRMTRDAT